MNAVATVADITTLIAWLIGVVVVVAGAFAWLITYMGQQKREATAAMAALRTELTAAADKRVEERERQNGALWTRISEIEHRYVRRDDLDTHTRHLDEGMKEVKVALRENTASVDRLVQAVLAITNRPHTVGAD